MPILADYLDFEWEDGGNFQVQLGISLMSASRGQKHYLPQGEWGSIGMEANLTGDGGHSPASDSRWSLSGLLSSPLSSPLFSSQRTALVVKY